MNDTDAVAASRRYFDGRADSWEAERQDYYSDAVREAVMQRGRFGADDVVVDYGAGTGFLTQGLVTAGVARVVAVDVSANMLFELGERYGSRVEVRLADGGLLPLSDAEATGVVANMVLHHLDDPPFFFQECRRVLRPGGRVVLTDMVSYDAPAFTRDQHDRWSGFDPEGIERWMEAAGLIRTQVSLIGERCCGTVERAAGGADIFLACAFNP